MYIFVCCLIICLSCILFYNNILHMRKFIASLFLLMLIFFVYNCSQPQSSKVDPFNYYYERFSMNNHTSYDSLMVLYKDIDSVVATNRDPRLIFLKITTEARLNFRQANYPKSNKKYMEANASLAGTSGVDSLLALNYMGIGINYMQLAAYDSSFVYYQKAFSLYEKSGNKYRMQVVQANMAQAYYNKNDHQKSLAIVNSLLLDSISVAIKLNVLHLKANILGSSGKIDSAVALDKSVIKQYANLKGQSYLISSFYNNLGYCFLAKAKIDSSLYYCRKSFEIDSLLGMRTNMAVNLVLMGDIYFNNNQRSISDKYYSRAMQIFTQDINLDRKLRLFHTLQKNARSVSEFEKAVQLQDSIIALYNQINDRDVNRTIELLEIEYETEKKNQLIENQRLKIKGQQILGSLIFLITLLIMAIIVFYFKNKSKKQQLKAAEQDRRVSEMLVQAEQNERSRIARDLHDGVSQKLAVVQMHVSMISTEQSESLRTVSDLLHQTVTDVRAISHNLYPKDLEKGILAALNHLCEQNNFVNKRMKFSLSVANNFELLKLSPNIELVIYRIVQEITNNALKYSNAHNVVIELGVVNKQISLVISDDGDGFDTTIIDSSKGIGLKNIFDRIRQISGKVTVFSKDKGGTQFSIEIPA